VFFDFTPAPLRDARQLLDGDPINAGRSLVAHHRIQRRFYVVGSQIASMKCSMDAGFRVGLAGQFRSLRVPMRGFTPIRHAQVQLNWDGDRDMVMRRPIYLPCPQPLSGPFGPQPENRPIMPSADFYTVVRTPCGDLSPKTQCRSLGVSLTAFIAHRRIYKTGP